MQWPAPVLRTATRTCRGWAWAENTLADELELINSHLSDLRCRNRRPNTAQAETLRPAAAAANDGRHIRTATCSDLEAFTDRQPARVEGDGDQPSPPVLPVGAPRGTSPRNSPSARRARVPPDPPAHQRRPTSRRRSSSPRSGLSDRGCCWVRTRASVPSTWPASGPTISVVGPFNRVARLKGGHESSVPMCAFLEAELAASGSRRVGGCSPAGAAGRDVQPHTISQVANRYRIDRDPRDVAPDPPPVRHGGRQGVRPGPARHPQELLRHASARLMARYMFIDPADGARAGEPGCQCPTCCNRCCRSACSRYRCYDESGTP